MFLNLLCPSVESSVSFVAYFILSFLHPENPQFRHRDMRFFDSDARCAHNGILEREIADFPRQMFQQRGARPLDCGPCEMIDLDVIQRVAQVIGGDSALQVASISMSTTNICPNSFSAGCSRVCRRIAGRKAVFCPQEDFNRL
jgi:hypothetical protein